MAAPTVYLCKGSDCRRRSAERDSLVKSIGTLAEVEPVRCQKICKGPVVGLEVDGKVEWFKSVRTMKARRALKRFLTSQRRDKRLFDRRVKKRAGKLRT